VWTGDSSVAIRAAAVAVALGAGLALAVAFNGAIARKAEPSFKDHFARGVYACAACAAPLFRSDDKFASTTRWPAYRDAVPGAVATRADSSEGLDRVEVLCASCGAHLGHVFPDGRLAGDTHPQADLRYCVLSSSLEFSPEP
jgi:peptide-methionine (R)-S-oxide reductase